MKSDKYWREQIEEAKIEVYLDWRDGLDDIFSSANEMDSESEEPTEEQNKFVSQQVAIFLNNKMEERGE